MKQTTQFVQSIERALKIMECFSIDKPSLSLGELSKMTGLSKSTVYRLVATLVSQNYMKQDINSQKYSLDFKLFHLGAIVIGNMNLRTVALPHIQELSQTTLETISLNIVEGKDRVCIDLVESPKEIRNFTRIGHRNRLWVGASGRILFAFLDEKQKEIILSEAHKEDKTIDMKCLEEELNDIVKEGYIVKTDARVKGSFAIVAPVFEHNNLLAGSITLSGPIHRYTEERIPFLIDSVRNTSKKISFELGNS